MTIAKICWQVKFGKDVSQLRKTISKSYGEEVLMVLAKI